MARRWQAVQVELLGGGGIECDPPPGRVLVCPTGTTFDQLGLAVDLAFARWDLSHLRMFELSDGTIVMDEELAADTVSAPFSPAIPRTVHLTERVSREVSNGDVFSYTFDLGDNWRHRCEVIGRVDPEEVLGIVPDRPTAYWGWGLIPDQYGRRGRTTTARVSRLNLTWRSWNRGLWRRAKPSPGRRFARAAVSVGQCARR